MVTGWDVDPADRLARVIREAVAAYRAPVRAGWRRTIPGGEAAVLAALSASAEWAASDLTDRVEAATGVDVADHEPITMAIWLHALREVGIEAVYRGRPEGTSGHDALLHLRLPADDSADPRPRPVIVPLTAVPTGALAAIRCWLATPLPQHIGIKPPTRSLADLLEKEPIAQVRGELSRRSGAEREAGGRSGTKLAAVADEAGRVDTRLARAGRDDQEPPDPSPLVI